jgi:hypothetical protein
VEGLADRTGRVWLERIPLLGKSNVLTLTATDAAGNASTTNLIVIRSDSVLTIDPVPTDQIWQLQVKVTGKVEPPNQQLWLNGREAIVKSDGNWVATGVALNTEGFAIFEATSISKSAPGISNFAEAAHPSTPSIPQESVSIQAKLGTHAATLNANLPTYGTFKLNLIDAAGRNFVLLASTNLIDWAPILTNRNSNPTFNYKDTNVMDYGCRFFRVIPID